VLHAWDQQAAEAIPAPDGLAEILTPPRYAPRLPFGPIQDSMSGEQRRAPLCYGLKDSSLGSGCIARVSGRRVRAHSALPYLFEAEGKKNKCPCIFFRRQSMRAS